MNRKLIFIVPLAMLALAVGATAAGAGSANSTLGSPRQTLVMDISSSGTTPYAPVGSGFTYQGSLKSSGGPANGLYDFQFTLYDSLAGGSLAAGPITTANVTVSNGLFTVTLDFGASAITGEARYMEIAVRQTGGGNYTTLTPRQSLTPAPYALSLRPGAVISGTTATILTANNSGNGMGINGTSLSGVGVNGQSLTGFGVSGHSSTGGAGVDGGSGDGSGVYGHSTSGDGVSGISTYSRGVYGLSTNYEGVRGETGSNYPGVFGNNTGSGGIGPGVRGDSNSGPGVYGLSVTSYGIQGTSTNSSGVRGFSDNVVGVSGTSPNGDGVEGTSTNSIGVYGYSTNNEGVHGEAGGNYAAVYGHNSSGGGVAPGVRGDGTSGPGVYGISTNSWAAYFQGDVNVTGGCCFASAGTYRIDDPQDPANKYLNQSAVESPDMKTIYDGIATTDANGSAGVTLPDWFQALNEDFRYQLTIMGDQFAQARISSEIKDNSFAIKTDKPNVMVSWQVTGIRHDLYAEKHPVIVQQDKPNSEKGYYVHPELYGLPGSKSVDPAVRNPLKETSLPAEPK